MTEKQKIKYISSYLSCDVDFYLAGNVRPFEKLEVHNLSQVLRNAYPLVLRPLSDLTKKVEVNGEKFVPIIEFFQLVDGGSYTEDRVTIKNEKGWFVISNSISQLSFNSIENYFDYKTFDFDGEDWQPSFNQLAIFNKLFEWHFDVYGLIENNLAIDINTL